jgi:hypothetical protein
MTARAGATPGRRDLARALAFYVGVLGMEGTFENGDPAGFVILRRDAVELHLTVAKDHHGSTCNVAHLIVPTPPACTITWSPTAPALSSCAPPCTRCPTCARSLMSWTRAS